MSRSLASSIMKIADDTPHWKQMHKVEATLNGQGKVTCKYSAALRIEALFESKVVFGTVAIEEWTGCPKKFRILYDGVTRDGAAACNSVELPDDNWRILTIKAKIFNVKARLLVMKFFTGDVMEIQLTLPINSHKDSKVTKAVVDSLVIYGAHHIKRKTILVGKEALLGK